MLIVANKHRLENGKISKNVSLTKVYIYHYEFNQVNRTCKWGLATDMEEVIGTEFNIASIIDLMDYVAACGYVYEGAVEVKEGRYIWNEEEHRYVKYFNF